LITTTRAAATSSRSSARIARSASSATTTDNPAGPQTNRRAGREWCRRDPWPLPSEAPGPNSTLKPG
jgi:hypothetical protein